MSKVLRHSFADVHSADAHPYGYGAVRDFIEFPYGPNSYDWVITNPPFKLAEEFVLQGLRVARRGVAILARTVFLESVGRYRSLFKEHPPRYFAQYVERVPMVKGRLDARATTATGYAWFVWEVENKGPTQVVWIPPCRKDLEKAGDYDLPAPPTAAFTNP